MHVLIPVTSNYVLSYNFQLYYQNLTKLANSSKLLIYFANGVADKLKKIGYNKKE